LPNPTPTGCSDAYHFPNVRNRKIKFTLGVAEYRKMETALVTLTIYLMLNMEKGHPLPPGAAE
jgi:hypothetical protein